MPFKSEAQKKKMFALEEQGKVKPGTSAKWEKETPKGKLPARLSPEKPIKSIAQIREKAKKA